MTHCKACQLFDRLLRACQRLPRQTLKEAIRRCCVAARGIDRIWHKYPTECRFCQMRTFGIWASHSEPKDMPRLQSGWKGNVPPEGPCCA